MVRQLASRRQQENLERWLEQRGFLGNPFGVYQAELEERLAEYFVQTGYYDEIKGSAEVPRTILVFAARGCGKSAHRIMVARDCRPTASYSEILAVPYTDFGTLPDKLAQDPKSVSLDRHLEEILRTAANTFLDTLVRDASLVDALKPEWLSRLKFFCLQHPENPILGPLPLLDRLRQLAGGDFDPDWNAFQQAWRTGELGRMLKRQPVWDNPVARFLIALADTHPEPVNIARLSAAKRFTLFVDLVRYTGLKAVYVLVDRMDEILPIADDLALIADFVEPLLADLPLMECAHAAFKFFLPMEAQPALAEKTTIRYDRLLFREIIWDEDSLAELLKQRLIAFSDGRVEALSDLCDETEVRRGWNLDQDIIQRAKGSPRRLLRLGELLLWAHSRQAEGAFSLMPTDWESALSEFREDRPARPSHPPPYPPLRLDAAMEAVWIGTKEVHLSDALLFLLSYLYDRDRQIVSNHELMTELELSYDNLRQQVHRIRQAIEPNPQRPVYLVSVPGRGLRLDNVVKM